MNDDDVIGPIFPMASDPSDPDSGHPIAGEQVPDDANAINSYFQLHPYLAPEDKPVERYRESDATTHPKPTRLQMRSFPLMQAWAPTQIMAKDPGRIALNVNAIAAAGNIYISDDASFLSGVNVASGVGVYRLAPGMAIALNAYTGPLWAITDTDGNVINAIAVTGIEDN